MIIFQISGIFFWRLAFGWSVEASKRLVSGTMNGEEVVLAVISTTLLVLLLIAGIVIAFFITGIQKSKQKIELAETKLVFEKDLRTVETEVTESIMGQFAQELHDNIGHLLTALHIQVENQKLDYPQLVESFKPA